MRAGRGSEWGSATGRAVRRLYVRAPDMSIPDCFFYSQPMGWQTWISISGSLETMQAVAPGLAVWGSPRDMYLFRSGLRSIGI